MRILVNFSEHEQGYITLLKYHLKKHSLEAIATPTNLSLGDLLEKAERAKCDGILLCNETTLRSIAPGEKPTLDNYRGSRFNTSIPIIVCNSLTHLTAIDHGPWLLDIDLAKFKHIKKPQRKCNFTVLKDVSMFDEAFEKLSQTVVMAYDIETKTFGGTSKKEKEETDWIDTMPEAGDTLITCCSWSGLHKDGSIVTYILPLINFNVTHWVDDISYAEAIGFLRKVNALPIPKVMQNGMYDVTHSICYHAEPRMWFLDTMGLHHSEWSSLPKDLGFVSSVELYDHIQWKDDAEAASKSGDIDQYWAYNAKDTFYTLLILIEQLKRKPDYALRNYSIAFPNVFPALYCNFEGFKVDMSVRNRLRQEANIKLDLALGQLRTITGDLEFNPSSPKQVAFYVYDIFGATDPRIGWRKDPVTKKKTKVSRGTDEKNLFACADQHPLLLRFVNRVISYREARKAISTYFDFYLKNGRFYWSLDPFGTDTMRMACKSSSFWCGTQVQNVPSYAKEMCVADDGYEIMEADNSQSEARCTGYLAAEWNLVKALETPGKDFYKSLGTLFFGIVYEEVTKEFRNAVLKKIVHGTNYMMGDATFVENAGKENLLFGANVLGVKITMGDAPSEGTLTFKQFGNQLLESYHKPFPRVRMWYGDVKAEIRSTNMLRSPSGYTRYFFGNIDKKYQIFSSAVAHGPQHLSVFLVNKGLWKVWELTKKSGGTYRLKAQIHDSILGQKRLDHPEHVQNVLTAMDNSIIVNKKELKIPVDYKLGLNWGKGMVEYK